MPSKKRLRRAPRTARSPKPRKRGAKPMPRAKPGKRRRVANSMPLAQATGESEDRFRALAVHSPMGIFQCNLLGVTLFANDRYRTISGISASEDEPFGWLRTVHPDDRAGVLAAWHAAIKTQSEFVREFRYLHADGTRRWALGSAVPLFDDAGRVTSYLGNVLDITERKTAEESLRAGEERFRRLTESAPIGIFLSDETGNIVYVNPRVQTIYAYPLRDLMGLGFARIYRGKEREAILANWKRIASTTDEHDVERTVANGMGETRMVRVQSAPMLSPTGTVLGRIGTVSDVTKRHRIEAELRLSEERYRLLAENANDVISTCTAEGVFVYVSPACRVLLGYEPAELVGKHWFEFVNADDRPTIAASRRPADGRLDAQSLTYRARRKNGQLIWLETIWKSVPDADDLIGRGMIVAVSRDISARQAAIEQLQASEADLRAILDTATDGIVTVDESGTIERFNPGAERLFGYGADEVLGQDIRVLIPTEQADGLERRSRRPAVFRRPLARTRETIGRRKDGTTCELEVRVGETKVGGRTIFTAILQDVSQRKQTERILRETEKLAATGRIAARIAHEINNPLAGVKNSFLLVKDAIATDHQYFHYVARIEAEIDRIGRIVRQMFDLYRPAQSVGDPIDLGESIRDLVTLLQSIALPRNVKIMVDSTRAGAAVRLSEDSMRQVLCNILVNAIEASPPGGLVKIEAGTEGDGIDVFVSDQGPGIPPDARLRIYEPFYTTKDKHGTGGLGLGLSIARGIVETMQGTLSCDTTGERGTRFHISIPKSLPRGSAQHVSTTTDSVCR